MVPVAVPCSIVAPLRASLDDMDDDGRTLFDWLKVRDEVDPRRVGIVGVSQGGWVGPLVAASRPEAAFLIGLTGGGMSPRAIEEFDYERKLSHGGVVGTELANALKAVATYLAYLAGDVPRAEIMGLLEAGKVQSWYAVLGLHRVLPDESFRAAWAWVPRMDPLPSIRSLRLPVLAIIGGLDREPAVEVNAWQAGLAKNASPRRENPRVRAMFSPRATHVRRAPSTFRPSMRWPLGPRRS